MEADAEIRDVFRMLVELCRRIGEATDLNDLRALQIVWESSTLDEDAERVPEIKRGLQVVKDQFAARFEELEKTQPLRDAAAKLVSSVLWRQLRDPSMPVDDAKEENQIQDLAEELRRAKRNAQS